MSLNSRLRKLEAAIAARRQQQANKSFTERLEAAEAKYSAMDDETLLAEYKSFVNAPLSPELAAKFDSMTADQLIKEYFQMIKC